MYIFVIALVAFLIGYIFHAAVTKYLKRAESAAVTEANKLKASADTELAKVWSDTQATREFLEKL